MESRGISSRGRQTCASHKKLFIAIGALIVACIVVGVTVGVIYGRKSAEEKEMWVSNVEHGISVFHTNSSNYKVYRNVLDFGCKGDGVTDDTPCINAAISFGDRCDRECGSSTIFPGLIYFPSGRYLISSPIIMYYYTQLVGNAKDPPTLIAAPDFSGSSVIDSNPPNWYTNQNNFFRQVRNFVIDMTQTPSTSQTTGIHWQVAQATSLVNIHFVMSTAWDTAHRGIFMENGSGGFMSDLKFTGGKFGMWVGNQQFLSINMEFNQCETAIYMNWNWQWTFKNLKITNARIGIDMSATSSSVQSNVGSILLVDSSLTNTTTGVLLRDDHQPNSNDMSGTLLLDNVQVNDVYRVVQGTSGDAILTINGQHTIASWGRGSLYTNASGRGTISTNYLPSITKSASLLDSEGKFFQRSRPQYENLISSDFVSVKAGGARGDGASDDSEAVQAVINANVNNGKVVYFPAGTYLLFTTVKVPPGVKIAGEIWAVIMAGGDSSFKDANNPKPVLQIGEPGQTGDVEITDIMFGSMGAQPGAILVQWNIKQGSQGSAGMWDSHFRVGGTKGSNLQVEQCPRGQAAVSQCNGVHTLLHITPTGSGYFENVWAWTADHDLDEHGQISIYTGRGVLIESTDGPVWLYGTQSEHNVLYQYQLSNARNIFMTMIQSETPYWQPGPPAPLPYTANPAFDDPTYSHCAAGDIRCPMSYAIRASRSSNVYVYGAGMYNFFSDYNQTCLQTEDCQTSMVGLENNTGLYMYNINTKAAINMVVEDNTKVLARSNDNSNSFCQTINAFLVEVEENEEKEMWVSNVEHGISVFHTNSSNYQVYRNVLDFGCQGDGVTDDTSCINTAISFGDRCDRDCGSSTILPGLIYFPSGRYLISSPIIMYYYTQLVGNAKDPPTLIAAPEFSGSSVIDSNPPNWYTNQNNFFRQVRNFVIDMTQTPSSSQTTGIHWQVAQATSLFNIHFVMSSASDTAHRGIFMENGSGGFMSDLKFTGGKFGMWVGNQQFLSINMDFNQCETAIYMNWNWQWTFKNLKISNARIGIDMSAASSSVQSNIGSILVVDSILTNTTTGVLLRDDHQPNSNDMSGTLLLDNVQVNDVSRVVQGTSGEAILTVNGLQTIASWGRGSLYTDDSGSGTISTNYLPTVTKSASLLDSEGKFFQRSRPQYENLVSSDFVSVKAGGARGDGATDDSQAVQAVINANANNRKVIYFPAGTYLFFTTVKVPPGVRIAGEIWAVIMAGGDSTFKDSNNPKPVLQIGEPGQTGDVEITDIMFGSMGAQPGAILVQWNIKQGSQGSAGMWDSHFRVGGTKGSNLQVEQCPRGQAAVSQCNGVHTLLHITPTGSGYFENVWAWTADHDLDEHGQISIYTGRGVLIESTEGPVWMYGTQSEHNVLYQYQLSNARNIFMTMIQSETPYWQPGPPAPLPYTANPTFDDPTYSHCVAGDIRCPMSYAIRASRSSNVYVYGAGMYNFFSDYDSTCLQTEDCQASMVGLESNTGLYMYNINTKAAVNMVVEDNTKVLARSNDNSNSFCQTINAFLVQV